MDDLAAWIVIGVMALAVWGGIDVAQKALWPQPVAGGEQEGTVKYEDCREQLVLTENSALAQHKKFTCSYAKSNSGKLMGGICVAVEMSGESCKTAYIYLKKPWTTCPQHSALHTDDMCYPDSGYHWVLPDKQALEPDGPPDWFKENAPDPPKTLLPAN